MFIDPLNDGLCLEYYCIQKKRSNKPVISVFDENDFENRPCNLKGTQKTGSHGKGIHCLCKTVPRPRLSIQRNIKVGC